MKTLTKDEGGKKIVNDKHIVDGVNDWGSIDLAHKINLRLRSLKPFLKASKKKKKKNSFNFISKKASYEDKKKATCNKTCFKPHLFF